MNINVVNYRSIEELSDKQLSKLLQILVFCEVQKHQLQGFHYISQKVNAADGGEDGFVQISDPKASNWIKSKQVLYQCKATNLTPAKCKAELLVKDQSRCLKIKPAIKEVLDRGGTYILFMSKSVSTRKGLQERLTKFKEAAAETGLSYKDEQFVILDAQKISEWTCEFGSAVTFVLECTNRTRPEIFRTWKRWGEDFAASLRFDFQSNSIYNKVEQLKTYLKTQNAIRVIGHSGIGKTRLVYETLAFDETLADTEQNIMNLATVYLDYAITPTPDLAKFIINHKTDVFAIIVVDNCPDDIHQGLAGLVQSNSLIKIVTIDFSLETSERNIVNLTRDDQKDTVGLMLRQIYPTLPNHEIDKLSELAEGYPKMVELMQQAISKNGVNAFTAPLPKNFVENLIFGRNNQNQIELEVIRACAIFSEFYFIDEEVEDIITDQVKLDQYKAHKEFIAREVCKPSVDLSTFYRTCRALKNKKGILERRGFFYSVVPTPLAAHLAAEWLLDFPPEDYNNFCLKLVEAGLIDAFAKRLRSLDQIEKAKTLVSKLWGPNGPFVTTEVINTVLGSRLFRSVVEVNPEATSEALDFIYGTASLGEIIMNSGSRRNLVWALEKLVFRKDYFEVSGSILARFAAAEIEDISNNATGQFIQLFQVHIPGTEASLNQRLNLIDYCIGQPEIEFKELVIAAFSRALRIQGLRRSGGAERQGFSQTLKDYEPTSWEEIFGYWENFCKVAIQLAKSYPELIPSIKTAISKGVRTLIGHKQVKIVEWSIAEIKKLDDTLWEDGIAELRKTLKYEKLSKELRMDIESLLESLIPKDIENQLRYLVSKPEWNYEEILTDNKDHKLKSFAEELIANKIDLHPYLHLLLEGEQRKGVIFGRFLVQLIDDPIQFGIQLIDTLTSISYSNQNSDLIAGYLSVLQDDQRQFLLDLILSKEEIRIHAFNIVRFSKPTATELEKLLSVVEFQHSYIAYFRNIFIAGNDHLSNEEIFGIVDRISIYGNQGKWTALFLLDQLLHIDKSHEAEIKDRIRRLLIENNYLIIGNELTDTTEYYRWNLLVEKLLYEKRDPIFAQKISGQIREAIKLDDFNSSFNYVDKTCYLLVKDYFDEFWNELSDALLSNGIEYFNLRELLGTENGHNGHSGLLALGNVKVIMEWCNNNSPKAPKRIAYMMPIYAENGNWEIEWHPFAKGMIDNFHQIEGFLDEVSANMGSFSWVGSAVQYLETELELLSKFKAHSSSNVRTWAINSIKSVQKRIKLEKIQNEQDRIL